MKVYDRDGVRKLLRNLLQDGRKKQKALAAEIGIAPAHLSMIMCGRFDPNAAVLRFLGLRREKVVTVTYYEDGKKEKR